MSDKNNVKKKELDGIQKTSKAGKSIRKSLKITKTLIEHGEETM